MSKKDKSQVEGFEPQVEGAEEAVTTEAVTTEAEKLERFKKMKRDAAVRFKERRAKEKTERIDNAKALIEELKNGGYWDKVSDNGKAFLSGLANPTVSSGNNQSLFRTLFGDNPQVGDSFTLNEAFQKTLKGKSNLDFYVKRWAEKGTIVSFKQNAENILDSVYTLESIGSAVPVDAAE